MPHCSLSTRLSLKFGDTAAILILTRVVLTSTVVADCSDPDENASLDQNKKPIRAKDSRGDQYWCGYSDCRGDNPPGSAADTTRPHNSHENLESCPLFGRDL